jgi:sugar phosphate isomerase/epimerase
MKPRLSWFPVRHLLTDLKSATQEANWLQAARSFGFSSVELHESYLRTPEQERTVTKLLERAALSVSMVTCGPDLASPDEGERARQVAELQARIATARRLGAPAVRVTAGINRPNVPKSDAIGRAREALIAIAEDQSSADVTLCLENHFRDRTWLVKDARDLTFEPEDFLALIDGLRGTSVRVNFDTSQPMLTSTDPVALLREVLDLVFNVHVGDRQRGQRNHAVIGEGDVDFDHIFTLLRRVSFSGFLSVEDASDAGDDGLRRGLDYLRARVAAHWNQEASSG